MKVDGMNKNLGALVSADMWADKAAIIDLLDPGNPRTYSYAQLDTSINSVARSLQSLGFAPLSRIAIISKNRYEFLVTYFGIMRAGLVAVPINYRQPKDLVEFVLDDCGACLVFCDTEQKLRLNCTVPTVEFGSDCSGGFNRFTKTGICLSVDVEAGTPALYLYTSGSTGRPKGVELSHSGYLWTIHQRLSQTNLSDHRFLVAAPLYHMNALNTIKLALGGHATLVLMPEFDSSAYANAIEKYQCTWLTAIPTMIAMLARDSISQRISCFSEVKVVRMGSEPLTQNIIDDARRLFPNAALSNGYGTTESGSLVFGVHPKGLEQPLLSVGYPHSSVELRLADGDNVNAIEGVLQVRSPALMLRYHGLPDLTNRAMTDDGYYITGDLMRRDEDGFYYFLGRSDDMFVCGGENIYPSEVERLLEQHPDIQQACVIPIVDAIKGKKPGAIIVKRPGAALDENAVRAYSLNKGPAYSHPRWVYFVDSFPISGTGKLDRKAIAQLFTDMSQSD